MPMTQQQSAQLAQKQQPQQGPAGAKKDPQRKIAALVLAVKKKIFTKGVTQQLVAMIERAPDPVVGIAQAASMIESDIGRAFGLGDSPLSALVVSVAIAYMVEIAVASGLVPKNKRAIIVVTKAALEMYQKQSGKQQPQGAPGAAPAPVGEQPAQQQPQPPAPPGGGLVAEQMEG